MKCPRCEYNKLRAARWRAEAYKLGGYDGIELPWIGLTDEEVNGIVMDMPYPANQDDIRAIEQALKEKNT